MKTTVIRWNIEIYPQLDTIASSSILNTKSEEYESFIDSLCGILDAKGYELYDERPSDTKGSQSMYYEFLKLADDAKIKLVIFVRISDHMFPGREMDGKYASPRKLQLKYHTRRAGELAKDANMNERPLFVNVNIIFDDRHMSSYDEALYYIQNKAKTLK